MKVHVNWIGSEFAPNYHETQMILSTRYLPSEHIMDKLLELPCYLICEEEYLTLCKKADFLDKLKELSRGI